MYSSYTAASFARKHDLAEKHGVNLEGALTWAFEFEDQPLLRRLPRAGHATASTLPVLNVFRMFSKMGGSAWPSTATAPVPLDAIAPKTACATKPDVAALASRDEQQALRPGLALPRRRRARARRRGRS